MKALIWFTVVCLSVSIVPGIIADDDAPKSVKVRRAHQSFLKQEAKARTLLEKQIADAQQEYLMKLSELGEDYRSVLDEEQKEVTKKGDLEEALKIKDIAEQLETSLGREQANLSVVSDSSALTVLESKLAGTHWQFSGGQKIYLTHDGEGGFLSDERKFQWSALSSHEVIVRYLKTNYVELFDFDLEKGVCKVRAVGFVGKVSKNGKQMAIK